MWAPHATQVSVIGDFNHRAPEATPLERWGDSGIWTGFVPGVREEALLGLRIDRPDGLLNPGEYCGRLQQAVG